MKEFKTKRYLTPWYVNDYHMWKEVYGEGNIDFKVEKSRGIISSDSHITTIGSCFAHELGSAMSRLGLKGSGHPPPPYGTNINFYNTTSVK